MPALTTCPACRQDLLVPDAGMDGAELRCPSCDHAILPADCEIRELRELIVIPRSDAGSRDVGDDRAKDLDHGDQQAGPTEEVPAPVIVEEASGEELSGEEGQSLADHPLVEDPYDSLEALAAIEIGAPNEDGIEVAMHSASDAVSFTAELAQRRGNAGSPWRFVFGWVISGAVGLAVGYFILLWVGGPDRDFLDLGSRLPPWAVPPDFQEEPW